MREPDGADPAEAALLERARRRDPDAVDALYAEHAPAARGMAIALAGPGSADDLVADAFARVIAQLHAGRGPADSFRSYLLATVRNRFRDVQRRARREVPAAPRSWLLERNAEPVEGPEAELDRSQDGDRAAAAFNSLSEEWREVLWHLELRDRPLLEVAGLLGMTPAAVSSLAYRAREGLRVAYLDQGLAEDPRQPECRWVHERVSRYLRHRVSERAARRIEAHLLGCESCAEATVELGQVNRRLAAPPIPLAGRRRATPPTGRSGCTPGVDARACAQRQA